MHYVCFIQNIKNKKFYYGYTSDLRRRFKEHKNRDKNWELVYYEAYKSAVDARKRESNLKDYGQARTHLKNRAYNSIVK